MARFAGKLVSFLIPNLGNFPAYSASLSKLLLFSFIIGGGGGKWERKMVCIRKRVKVCVCVCERKRDVFRERVGSRRERKKHFKDSDFCWKLFFAKNIINIFVKFT